MPRRLVPTAALFALLASGPALAADAPPFSGPEKAAIEEIVRDYLLANPEILLEMSQALEARQEQARQEAAQAAIQGNRAALFDDPATPELGNPDGDVAVVEFFDYRCGYCKRVFQPVLDAVRDDGKVRLLVKELPILGPQSVLAATAALAAREQDGYAAMHAALMTHRGGYDEATIGKLAGEAGLDAERLLADMADPQVQARIETALAANRALAGALGVSGTPAFVVGDTFVPGAISQETLVELIRQARTDG
ncbi:DsbA family protein [Roseospirillum parvum]|uniref:Protein-disulfide isomerase n=1 Tax=Roseospirillum parvum TaxID=83401 RepID=A0A1G8CKM6_9PROT|nr:DsbA family protein [Roseospirillum parvum]SDH46097.1 Protein-disulfide isomerase [Roseospirillum parvum]